jgi:hypothetical protein
LFNVVYYAGTKFWRFQMNAGNKVFVQTVTMFYTGKVAELKQDGYLVLEQAAWIADTGRFADFLKNGKANEVEPVPNFIYINLDSIVAIIPWDHELPREQK